MASESRSIIEEHLESEDTFRANAFTIICEMVELSNRPSAPIELVNEVLHSIFFLGKINKPPYSPEMIFVGNDDLLEELKQSYPRPFDLYSSQLPKRSPFSCILDMIRLTEEDKENIIPKLQELNQLLSRDHKAKHLISTTVCVSQNTEISDSVRYYGVSMCTSGRISGQIMVAASCYSFWDSYVADAVLTYYPVKEKKQYFDGTFRLPKIVQCQAFRLSDRANMDPCKSCGNLFGLHADERKEWAYGHCAEVESVSNLFKNEREIKQQVRLISDTCTDKNRQQLRLFALKRLTGLLHDVGFTWDNKFYPNIDFDPKKGKLVTVTN